MYQFNKNELYYYIFIHASVFWSQSPPMPPTIGSPSKSLKQKWICIHRAEKLVLFIQEVEETSPSLSKRMKGQRDGPSGKSTCIIVVWTGVYSPAAHSTVPKFPKHTCARIFTQNQAHAYTHMRMYTHTEIAVCIQINK